MHLAGQVIETQHGTFTVIIHDILYRRTFENHFDSSTPYGGYPNLIDSPVSDEIGRIISTLIDLRERRIASGVDLAQYEPLSNSLVYIEILVGRSIPLSEMMPGGMFDPELTRGRGLWTQYRSFEMPDGTMVQIASMPGHQLDGRFEQEESIHYAMAQVVERIFYALMREAALGMGIYSIDFANRYLISGFDAISKSPFGGLFSNEAIESGMTAFGGGRPQIMSKARQDAKFGVPSVFEIDFDRLLAQVKFTSPVIESSFPSVVPWDPHEPPPIYDNFEINDLRDDLWQLRQENSEYFNYLVAEGVLTAESISPPSDMESVLSLTSSASRTLEQVSTYEARLRIHRQAVGNFGQASLQLGADVPGLTFWVTGCRLGTPFFADQPNFDCFVSPGRVEYLSQLKFVEYDKWYSVRIEINPDTGHLQYYLDDELLDTYAPTNASDLISARFYPHIRLFAKKLTSFSVDIDDIRLSE